MNLHMDAQIGEKYTSSSQRARVITEAWVDKNMFCPYCGNQFISHYENNRPVADFFCPLCREEYELKSKGASIRNKVNDGAYNTMIARINSINNPNFFFLHYDKRKLQVENLIMVPKYFFLPEIIEKRKPLAENAKRSGWIGCNILLNQIPNEGRVFIIQNEAIVPIEFVLDQVRKTEFLRGSKIETRGWTLDVLSCVNKIEGNIFSLEQMYQFENILSIKHPDNHHIRDKIRQQLQILRDNGLVEFIGRGRYRKV